jgi:hypothetical protein
VAAGKQHVGAHVPDVVMSDRQNDTQELLLAELELIFSVIDRKQTKCRSRFGPGLQEEMNSEVSLNYNGPVCLGHFF